MNWAELGRLRVTCSAAIQVHLQVLVVGVSYLGQLKFVRARLVADEKKVTHGDVVVGGWRNSIRGIIWLRKGPDPPANVREVPTKFR